MYPSDMTTTAHDLLSKVRAKYRAASWSVYQRLRAQGLHVHLTNPDFTILLIHYLPSLARQLRMSQVQPIPHLPTTRQYTNYVESQDQESWLPVKIRASDKSSAILVERVQTVAQDWLTREDQVPAATDTHRLRLVDYRVLILALCQLSLHTEARQVLLTMQRRGFMPKLGVLSPLMAVYHHHRMLPEAQWVLDQVRRQEPFPSTYMLTTMLELHCQANQPQPARALYDEIRRMKFAIPPAPYVHLMKAYARARDTANVIQVYNDLHANLAPSLSINDRNALVRLLAGVDRITECLQLLCPSRSTPLNRLMWPKTATLLAFFHACQRSQQFGPGLKVAQLLQKQNVRVPPSLAFGLATFYAANGSHAEATRHLAKVTQHPSLVAPENLVAAFEMLLSMGELEQAQTLAARLIEQPKPTTVLTFRSLVQVLLRHHKALGTIPTLFHWFQTCRPVDATPSNAFELQLLFLRAFHLLSQPSQVEGILQTLWEDRTTLTIAYYHQLGEVLLALKLPNQMVNLYQRIHGSPELSGHPDTYVLALRAYSMLNEYPTVQTVWNQLRHHCAPRAPPPQASVAMMEAMVTHASATDAVAFYDIFCTTNPPFTLEQSTVLINTLCQVGALARAVRLYSELLGKTWRVTGPVVYPLLLLAAQHAQWDLVELLDAHRRQAIIAPDPEVLGRVLGLFLSSDQHARGKELLVHWSQAPDAWSPSERNRLAVALDLTDVKAQVLSAIPVRPEVQHPNPPTSLQPETAIATLNRLRQLTERTDLPALQQEFRALPQSIQTSLPKAIYLAYLQAFRRLGDRQQVLSMVQMLLDANRPGDPVETNAVLYLLAKTFSVRHAVEWLSRMVCKQAIPSPATFRMLIAGCTTQPTRTQHALLKGLFACWIRANRPGSVAIALEFITPFAELADRDLVARLHDTIRLASSNDLLLADCHRWLGALVKAKHIGLACQLLMENLLPTKRATANSFSITLDYFTGTSRTSQNLPAIPNQEWCWVQQLYTAWRDTGLAWTPQVAHQFVVALGTTGYPTDAKAVANLLLSSIVPICTVWQFNQLLQVLTRLKCPALLNQMLTLVKTMPRSPVNHHTFVLLMKAGVQWPDQVIAPRQLAQQYFDHAKPAPGIATLNQFLQLWSQHGMTVEFDELWGRMQAQEAALCDTYTYGIVIGHYCRVGRLPLARELFHRLRCQSNRSLSVASYNQLIAAEMKAGRVTEARELLQLLETQGLFPDMCTYTALVHGFNQAKRWAEASQLVQLACDRGIHLDAHLITVAMNATLGGGQLSASLDLCQRMLSIQRTLSASHITQLLGLCTNALDHRPQLQQIQAWVTAGTVAPIDAPLRTAHILAWGRLGDWGQVQAIWEAAVERSDTSTPLDFGLRNALVHAAVMTTATEQTKLALPKGTERLGSVLNHLHALNPHNVSTRLLNSLLRLLLNGHQPDCMLWVFQQLFSQFQRLPDVYTFKALFRAAKVYQRPALAKAVRDLVPIEYPQLTVALAAGAQAADNGSSSASSAALQIPRIL
ncbi:hypothetical protein H4R34_002620 [Dimargaris verticillata]|uniref:Pentacotripeptide-repeat region of PRORP domain-containing protein n=1 Tax=Dimargaris verticillata TaxID=2761393 RepID=A0A9W8B2E9_9FUNG|nr:hypothetical protein H4R34_002620 [Dimargaris verticillata]